MVQLDQYDASPSVSVEPDANVEVNSLSIITDYLYVRPVFGIGRGYGLRLKVKRIDALFKRVPCF